MSAFSALMLAKAVALHSAGLSCEARAVCRALLDRVPGCAEAWGLLGAMALDEGDPGGALPPLERAAVADPAALGVRLNLARALEKLGRRAEAVPALRQALTLAPGHAGAASALGAALFAAGREDEAAAACRRALALEPDSAPDWITLCGAAAGDLGVTAGRVAVRLAPDRAAAHYNLATALLRAERPAAAAEAGRRAVLLDPGRLAGWDNLGTALYYAGRPEAALEAFGRALALEPGRPATLWNKAQALLISGRLREGFALYEQRWSVLASRPSRPSPLWDGAPLDGRTLLLVAEQAFGDVLEFARYVPLVRGRGGRVVLEVRPPLLPLFQGWAGADAVVPAGRPVAHDLHLPFMSLPHALGIGDCDHLARSVPYLAPPAKPRVTVPKGEGRAIGLVWTGRQTRGNLRRSCPAAALLPLLSLPGLRFVSAQVDAPAGDVALLAGRGMAPPAGEIRDFADLAGLLAGLDLLLTVDSAPAHLAGAMGLPVWTMLAHGADWRWLLDRADSPWYPTMRLFRQKREGDWAGLVDEVAAALAAAHPQAS